MKKHLQYYLLVIIFVCGYIQMYSQNDAEKFTLKVKVVDDTNNEPIKNASVSVNSDIAISADINGVYKVRAQVNDELVVSHPDFETVIHTIKSNEDVKILVRGLPKGKSSRSWLSSFSKKKASGDYLQLIDSANFYKTKDIDKSLCFVEEALSLNESKKRNANTYKVLGDIYFYWKQYDIAVGNYKLSLQLQEKTETLLQLAETLYLTKKYEESEKIYERLKKKKLSNYEKVLVYKGLANVLLAKKDFDEAEINYELGLELAEKKSITDLITELNSKLGKVYTEKGELSKATSVYSNSLKVASELPEEESFKVKEEAADFYNLTQQYDDEIKLRKELLENVDNISKYEQDKGLARQRILRGNGAAKDSLTSQKLNYKLGSAYVSKQYYPEAIEYLKKSIEEAEQKEDLEVKKFATRKLSEVYSTVGSYIKALKTYRDFVDIVDTLYLKKEQEIYQIKRLTKKIADNQSRIAILEKDKELSESKISIAYKDKELTMERSKRLQIVIYSLIGGLLLMSLLAFYKHMANRKQQLANNLLALKSMRSQMNPHFIFNALNSVNSFIAVNDERNANRYLSEFSVLMRAVLENSDEDFIPFTKEIELLELYVKLEHNRFRDKFDYNIEVDKSIDLEQYQIPPMLLQPYIENAIWHGLRYKTEKGSLAISVIQETEDSIKIIIQDDGIGRKKSLEMKTKNQLKQKSKGMSTIKNRIAILNDMYQDKVAVSISDVSEDGRGTKVEVTLKK